MRLVVSSTLLLLSGFRHSLATLWAGSPAAAISQSHDGPRQIRLHLVARWLQQQKDDARVAQFNEETALYSSIVLV